jgi:hypothetical protein
MLDTPLAICAQAIKAQTIPLPVYLIQQARAQTRPLRRIDLAFEHRVLHALAQVQTRLRDAP